MTHSIKCESFFYESVDSGEKTFEIRKMDRPYKMGDNVILQEFKDGKYTGRECTFRIGLVLDPLLFKGISKGYCVFSLVDIS